MCCDPLEDGQDVLACEGRSNTNVHRYCAGVTCRHYSKLTMGTNPFVCQFWALKMYGALVKQLQSEVERLKFKLASTKATLSEHTQSQRGAHPQVEAKTNYSQMLKKSRLSLLAQRLPTLLEQSKLSWDTQPGKVTSPDTINSETLPLSYAVVASARSDIPSKSKPIAHSVPSQRMIIFDKKYNLVLYGVKECPSGSSRSACLEPDLTSVVSVLTTFESSFHTQSIKDCYCLGKFSFLRVTSPDQFWFNVKGLS